MAGNAWNWFKVGKGSAKGQVFVSNKALIDWFGKTGVARAKAQIAADLAAGGDTFTPTIERLAAQSIQPGGQAKQALPPPRGWADDPVAQQLIEAQQATIPGETKSMFYAGTPAEKALLAAFKDANPDIYVNTSHDVRPSSCPPGWDMIATYQNGNHYQINGSMWAASRDSVTGAITSSDLDGGWTPSESYVDMQRVITSLKSPIDMTVTRAERIGHPLYAWAKAAGVGDAYVSKGFDSSSYNPVVEVMGNDVRIRMRVPKGSRGAALNAIFPNNYTAEQEWLFPANSSWVVTGKTVGADGKIEIIVDLVDQRNLDGSIVWP